MMQNTRLSTSSRNSTWFCNRHTHGGTHQGAKFNSWLKLFLNQRNSYFYASSYSYSAVNNTSVCKYWKILFYPSNTETRTFYGGSTDINTDAQYAKYSTDILVFPVFYSITILCLKPLIDSCYLRLLALTTSTSVSNNLIIEP